MPCERFNNQTIICYSNIAFEFRFLLWRCEFTDRMCAGPLWILSIPQFKFSEYISCIRRFGFKNVNILKYFGFWERDNLCLGDKNLLWSIFNYHYKKYMKEKNK